MQDLEAIRKALEVGRDGDQGIFEEMNYDPNVRWDSSLFDRADDALDRLEKAIEDARSDGIAVGFAQARKRAVEIINESYEADHDPATKALRNEIRAIEMENIG